MKRFFKSFLSVMAVALTSWMWATTTYTPMPSYTINSTSNVVITSPVEMPNPAVDNFTVTIMYESGGQRSDISQVELVDPETEAQVAVDTHEGFSGTAKENHVYTLSNIPASYAGKVLLVKSTVKCNEASGSSTCRIDLSNGVRHYVAPFSFGVNFTHADNQNLNVDDKVGYATDGYAVPDAWYNIRGSNSGNGTITVENQTLNVYWTARGTSNATWNSGWSTDTLKGKLLLGFLDDTINNARTKATVTITGLPSDKQYAVAVILAGDADNDGANGKYSPALINGQTYSYVGGVLVSGDAAKADNAKTWGNRRKVTAGGPSDLTEGQNVMFVEGLSGSILTITSAMEALNTSRFTIAGVQVWTTEDAVTSTSPSLPENAEVISVNFNGGGTRGVSGVAGLYPANGWKNFTKTWGTNASDEDKNDSASSLMLARGSFTREQQMDISFSANNTHQWDTAEDNYIKGYLDDGAFDGHNALISVENIPFEEYSVIVYAATDTENRKFKPVLINGSYYAGAAVPTAYGNADRVLEGEQNLRTWGGSRNLVAAYGANALRVDGLTASTLTIKGGSNGDGARGGIAAIQIVNTGDSILVETIDWTKQAAENMKVSALPEITKPIVDLILPDGATLIVDEVVENAVLNIVSAGAVTINVTNLTISQAQLNAMLNTDDVTGTVTNAYTETIGYKKDGVTYSLVYRGPTDGWGTASNWYTGTRTNGSETYWIPYSGSVPAIPGGKLDATLLIDGELIGEKITDDDDSYKVVRAPELEGWTLHMAVRNGVHLKITSIKKLQSANDNNNTGRISVDESSKVTITSLGTQGSNSYGGQFDILGTLTVENDFSATGNNPGYIYTLGKNGHVQYAGLSGARTHKVASVILNLGDSALTGKGIVERELVGFTSADANQTFTYEESGVSGVTNADESRTVTKKNSVVELSEIGDYCFVKRDNDGYYVVYMAYAVEFTATVDADGTTLSEALNGETLTANAILTIDFGETSGQFFTFDNDAEVSFAQIIVKGTNGGTIVMADGAEIDYGALVLNTTVAADAAFYAANSGAISGTGKLCLASGVLTLDEANTYIGGTDIAAGATLTMGNANAIGTTGNITGAGTLVCNGMLPANKNGLTANTWTGTVSIVDFTGSSASGALELNLDEYGSSTSLVQLTNVTGWVDGGTTVSNLRLEGDGLKLNNGSTTGRKTITVEHLTGTGTFSGATGSSWKYHVVVKDSTAFEGTIDLSETTSQYVSVVFGEGDAADGKIVIAKDTTIPAGKTWTAVNGIAIKDGATLTIMDARALPANKAITGTGTLAINGTVDLSGITTLANFEGKIEIKAGTLTLVTGVEGDMVVPEGCTLKLKGYSDVPYVSGATGAGTIQIIAPNGDILSETGSYEPSLLSGNCTWYEFLFEGDSNATRLANGGTAEEAIRGEDSGTWTFVDVGVTPARQALQIYNKYPWTNTAPTFNALETWSASCFAKMPTTEGGVLIGFGTTVGGTPGFIALVRGKGENKVLLVAGAALGAGYEILADFTVPNAEEAYHLYSFVRTATGVEIYLDGEPWAPYHQSVSVGNGFQIGSLHGGINHTYTGELTAYRGLSLTRGGSESDKNGMVDMLRIYRYALSSEDIQALAAEYAYISPSGSYARTLTTETSEWVATGTWANSANETAEKLDVPPSGAAVTVTTEIASTVTMNLSTESIAEALTLQGSGITIVGGENSAKMNVQGLTKVICNAEIDCGVVEMTGPVRVAEGAELTLNVTESLLDAVINGKALGKFTHPLTGAAEGVITTSTPGETYKGWNVTVEQDGTGAYILTVTRDNWYVTIAEEGSVTWAAGNSPETAGSVDVPDSALNAAITITANGDATVTLPTEMSKITIAGTGDVTLALPDETTATIPSLVIGAGANVTIPQALTVTAMEIGAGATIGYAAATEMTIAEPLTGNYNLTVVSGTVTLTGASANVAYTGTITVKDGATLVLGFGVGLPETAPITLGDGATLFAKNGAGISSTIASAITINGDVTIKGSEYGNNTHFTGAISGTGTLTIASGNHDNKFVIDGAITDELKVVVSIDDGVTFTSNENTFTGGLEIVEGGKLTVTHPGAMGTKGTKSVVNNGALTFAFPAEGEGSSDEYADVFSGTGDYTLASGSLTWKLSEKTTIGALNVTGGVLTVDMTVSQKTLDITKNSSITNGTLLVAPSAAGATRTGISMGQNVTLTVGAKAKLAFSGNGPCLRREADAEQKVVVESTAVVYGGGGIEADVELKDGATLDLYGYNVANSTGMPLRIGGQLTLPSDNGSVTVKTPLSLYKFLIYKGAAIPDWMSRFKFKDAEGEAYTLEGNTLVGNTCYLYETFESISNEYAYGFASVQSGSNNVQISPAAATDIANLVLGTLGTLAKSPEVKGVTNPNVAECFEGFAIDYDGDWENLEKLRDTQIVTLSYGFGVGNITVAKRTVGETCIAIAVKVTNGGMGMGADYVQPAALRSGTQIHLSKDGGDSYDEENALTPLTDDELETAGLENDDGVYWYWAETLPAIDSQATSTTVEYKVKAVNNGATPAQQ